MSEDENESTNEQVPASFVALTPVSKRKRLMTVLATSAPTTPSPRRTTPAASSAASSSQDTQTNQIAKLLSVLEKEHLVDLFVTILNTHPILAPYVSSLLPRPTLAVATQLLRQCEKRVADSFPYSRTGPNSGENMAFGGGNRSDYSFNRVRPAMNELRQTLLQYLTYFVTKIDVKTNEDHAACAFGYLHAATDTVHRLPVWTNPRHNLETRHDLYSQLSRAWRSIVMEVGGRLREEAAMAANNGVSFRLSSNMSSLVREWARNLSTHCEEVKGHFGFEEAVEEFERQFGWIVDPNLNNSSCNIGNSVVDNNYVLASSASPGGNGFGPGGVTGSPLSNYPWPMAAGHTPQQGLLSSPFSGSSTPTALFQQQQQQAYHQYP
ncbi:Tethering factor for nuclear proteasome sts1 [Quaeritorhiza haematococci]|nr:Tethering factor for nuclear proteasome sts1 [Quaeritorhiza haematococci]